MTAHTPLRCANSVMSAAPTAGARVVLLDTGNYPSFSSYLNETWTFSGTDWTNQSSSLIDPAGPLPGRSAGIMAFDGTAVMTYGGQGGDVAAGILQDTWTWNGTTWTKKSPATTPFGRYNAECAYLAGTGVVMFGGQGQNGLLQETWVWNGTTWSQVSTPNTTAGAPGARTGHAMAASASLVLLFGGQGTNSQSNHTWSFNGTVWTQLFPATSPSVRSGHNMAYDTVNNVWVMFGGSNEYNYLPETWVYTVGSATWTQVAVNAGPSGRVGHQMAFDVTSGKTILFGGINATTNYPANDTWSFNGATNVWTQL